MIKPHEPFQDGSMHAANEYCPTCHGHMDLSYWDSNGRAIQNARPRMEITMTLPNLDPGHRVTITNHAASHPLTIKGTQNGTVILAPGESYDIRINETLLTTI